MEAARSETRRCSIEITSRDQKWVLSISVSGAKTGLYRLAALREAGKAMVLLTGGDEPLMVRAHTGELKLEERELAFVGVGIARCVSARALERPEQIEERNMTIKFALSKRTLSVASLLAALILIGSAVTPAQEVAGPLRTLTGRIRWVKTMGVLPKEPRSIYPTENICAHFYVIVIQPGTGSLKPIQYDIALEAKPEPSKPDYYSCLYEMKVPSNVYLEIYPGMGDGMAGLKAEKKLYHYGYPWVAADGLTPSRLRVFKPERKFVTLGNLGMYVPFELMYDQRGVFP